jgi:hypothetical protein
VAIDVSCGCGYRMKLRDEHAGRSIVCPKCKEVVSVPLGRSAVDALSSIVLDAELVEERPAPTPAPESFPLRRAPARSAAYFPPIVGFLSGFCLCLLMVGFAEVIRPRKNWERIATQNSPEFQLAAFDTQGRPPVDPGKSDLYGYMLRNATDIYSDSQRVIAWEVLDTTALLNEQGYPTEAFSLLDGAIKAGQATRDRQGYGFEKIAIRSYMAIYEAFRKPPFNLSHHDAIRRIIEYEKL